MSVTTPHDADDGENSVANNERENPTESGEAAALSELTALDLVRAESAATDPFRVAAIRDEVRRRRERTARAQVQEVSSG